MGPGRAILLLVVCGEDSKKSPRAPLSPAGPSIRAAFPPGLGLELSLPRQLSSAWTRTRGPPPAAPAMSGLDDHRNVRVSQDFLRVGHDHGAGPALDVTHVRPGEQRVAADPFDDPGYDLPRLPRFHVRDERHPLHRQRRLRHAHDLEPRLVIVARMDEVNRAPRYARELPRHLEGPPARVAPVEG